MSEKPQVDVSRADIQLVLAAAVGALLVWHFSQVLLLLFAAIILAVLLHSGAGLVERHTPLKRKLSLLVVVVCIAAGLGTFGYLFGTQVKSELSDLLRRLPELAESAGKRFNIANPISKVQDHLSDVVVSNGMLASVAGYTSSVVGTMGGILLMIVGGVYLAADPGLYRHGLIMLFPARFRTRADEALAASGEALKRWLLGQLIAMTVVGIATTAGLYFIGLESALALGVIAGLLEFVPFFGPIMSAVPAVLIALSSDGYTVLWVIGLYVLIQQLENNLLVPIIQRRAVDLPPVLGIFAVIALGVAFGPLGILFGTPLTVVLLVLTKYLYIRGTLGEETNIPGVDGGTKDP